MKNWSQFQSSRPVGKIRNRLAKMICDAVLGVTIEPEDLHQQNPAYSRPETDACTWDAWGRKQNGQPVHFYSWIAMGLIVRSGKVSAKQNDDGSFNIGPA